MEKLIVLECDYVYSGWCIDTKTKKIQSTIKPFTQRKATDDYQLCGVYRTANIPYEIKKVTGDKYIEEKPYQAIPHAFSDLVCDALMDGNKVLISSGYCVYAPSIVGGIQRAIGENKKIGIVWIDAHADNVIVENTSEESVILVGVPLSTIMGQTMDMWRKESCGLAIPIHEENILVSDARCSDEECKRNLRHTKATWLNEEEFDDVQCWKKHIEELAQRVEVIFLMVDADILESKYIPAYDYELTGGHDVHNVMRNIEIVMQTNKVIAFASFCVDFDKYDSGGDTTYLNGMKIIASGLSSWKKRPHF